EPYLVYADWLQSRGDPRGELIMMQHAMRAAGNTTGFAKYKAHEEQLRAKHERAWLGEVVVEAASHRQCYFTWAMGFVDSATLHNGRGPYYASPVDGDPSLAQLLAALLASPCGWLVRNLTLHGETEAMREAAVQLPTVRLRHVTLDVRIGPLDVAKRELAP